MSLPCPSSTGRRAGSAVLFRALLLGAVSVAAIAPAPGDPAVAQEAPAGPDDALVLPAVTVTARRAEELLRDVPFTLSVIGGEEIEQRRLLSFEDVLRQTPGVSVNSNTSSNIAVRIRGVGSLTRTSADDNSVVVYVDGQPQPLSSATLSTFDVERVEILRGPQGTLFGRNSEGGAINIVNRRPTRTVEGYLTGEVGTEGHWLGEGAVSGPLTDSLSGRLAFRYARRDNAVHNLRNGEPLSSPQDFGVRGILEWRPADGTALTFTAAHEQARDTGAANPLRPHRDPPFMDVPIGSIDEDLVQTRVGLEASHALDWGVLTSVTSYNNTDNRSEGPFYDGLLLRQLIGTSLASFRAFETNLNTFNQEFRLSSLPESNIFWVAGVNFFHSRRSLDTRDAFDNLNPANPFNADIDRDYSTTSGAVFGEATYPLTEALRVTAGLRHTWERRTYEAVWRANAGNPNPVRSATDDQTLNDNFTTVRLGLSYAVNDATTVYGVYARGYNPGGFSDFGTNVARGLPDLPYSAAIVDSYEIGVRNVLDGGRLTFNAALFYNDTKDDHLYIFDPITATVAPENADTRSMGVELEGAWAIGGGFTLAGSAAYTHATIESVPATPGANIRQGNRVPDVPRWSTAVSLLHQIDLPPFLGIDAPQLGSGLTYRYVSTRPADPQNNFELDAYHDLGLRVGIAAGQAEVYLWGQNLLDERYDLNGFYYPAFVPGGSTATIGAVSQGRTFGVGARFAF